MVEFLQKICESWQQNHYRLLNSHHQINKFSSIFYGIEVRCDRERFSVQSIF